MPATLYTLVGRKHHAESPVSDTLSAPAVVEVETLSSESSSEAPVETKAEALIETAEASAEVDSSVSEPEGQPDEISIPKWEASWSKNQLLAVAQSLNLSVTSTSTKTEIINALSAVSKS